MLKISRKAVLLLFVFSVNLGTLKAQEKSQKITNDLSALIDKSSTFKNYKVIEKGAISNFQATLNSYIKQEQSKQIALRSKLKANDKEIVVLQNQMAEFKAKNDELISEKATIGFLGFSISKANYSISMWTLFLGTLIAAVILFLSFKRANKVTKDSKATLVDLEEEYQSYRGVCVNREQSLRRQLLMK
jgi:hypothetical protein